MVRLVKYQVDGGGTTVVEDSGDLLRAIGSESESSSSSNKKRVYSNDSSGEPSIEAPSARGVVLTLRDVNGRGDNITFTSRRSVVYPPSTSIEFSLSQSQHNNVLAFTVSTYT